MILIYHKNNKVNSIASPNIELLPDLNNKFIIEAVYHLAQLFPEAKIVWCHEDLKVALNLKFIRENKSYEQILFSFTPNKNHYLTETIGYLEQNPFININKSVTYPTWLMSSAVGFAHAKVFLKVDKHPRHLNWNYFLNSLAKTYQPVGLFCYSEPRLLLRNELYHYDETISKTQLFKFVKQHYKARWIIILMINLWIYEKKFPLWACINSFFYKKINSITDSINNEIPSLPKELKINDTVDVIIPTIGRKKYLYDVLCDLKNQTILPKTVIIVEQNGQENTCSELNYLTDEIWPFNIKHTFTHKLGACNARNIALGHVTSDWVFLADDDIRFKADFLEVCLDNCKRYGQRAITLSCLPEGISQSSTPPYQCEYFGSGCSFIARATIENLSFHLGYEFGYREDVDFGMQIRNKGTDIVFFSHPTITHLKAPVGGFRTSFVFPWEQDKILPKPSPTVMLYHLLHSTPQELCGAKTLLFLNYYPLQKRKNPIKYAIYFKKQWNISIHWARKLRLEESI